VTSVGRGVLDELKAHEGALSLQEVLRSSKDTLGRGAFRVVHGDGLLYEVGLAGGWDGEVYRLIEFDRPQGPVVRVYGEPVAFRRRRRLLSLEGRHALVALDKIVAPYADYVAADLVEAVGAHSLRKAEETVGVSRFLDAAAALPSRELGEMTRYVVSVDVEGGEAGGEVKACAALAETAFDNALEALLGGGWAVEEGRDALLEAHPLAAKVRLAAAGIGACTWWDDAACLEMAELLEAEDAEDVLEGVGFRRLVSAARAGTRRDKMAQFVELKSYPDEPTL